MRPVAVDFVVEGVIHCNEMVTMVVDGVCEEEETSAVAGPVIASGVAPGGCDEEVCVDGSGGMSTLWLGLF